MPSFPSRMIRSRAFDEVGRAPALGADLDDSARPPRGVHHRLPLGNVDADRLLNVDVGPRLDGGNHRQGVPVVGRGDQDDVKVALGEHCAVIAISPRLLLRRLPEGDLLGGLLEHDGVDVADRDDFHVGLDLEEVVEVELAIPPRADQADPARPGSRRCSVKVGGQDQAGGSGPGGGLEEVAAVHRTVLPKRWRLDSAKGRTWTNQSSGSPVGMRRSYTGWPRARVVWPDCG